MANIYNKPGVSVDELLSPNIAPAVTEPTTICLIGPTQGFQTNAEIVMLDDKTPSRLAMAGIDKNSVSVTDAANTRGSAFSSTSDYTISTDGVATLVTRKMQTSIANGETVVVYHENPTSGTSDYSGGSSDDRAIAHTDTVKLDRLTAAILPNQTTHTDLTTVKVISEGIVDHTNNFSISGSGSATVSIVRDPTSTLLSRFQDLYIDYDDVTDPENPIHHTGLLVPLNWASGTDQSVDLPDWSDNHVVKTASDVATDANSAQTYNIGTFDTPTGTATGDYILSGSVSSTNIMIKRSSGSTTIGNVADRLQVRISYTATPSDFWQTTQMFSHSDVEDKYGPAFDTDGSINSVLSFGALLAFNAGASNIFCQPLFSNGSTGRVANDGSSLQGWADTLEELRNREEVNVIVPLIVPNTAHSTDDDVLNVFNEVAKHIDYMRSVGEYVFGLFGEDATGSYGSPAAIQQHGVSLANSYDLDIVESMTLVTPGSFSFSNPVSSHNVAIGGQYVAAILAGRMSNRPVQEPLTRKTVVGVNGINVIRSEREKNDDAASGLTVVELKNGLIRIRHAITLAQAAPNASVAQREVNVVRAKHHVIESVRDMLDTQIIGNINADARAAFTVQVAVTSILESMVSKGVIVSYSPSGVQARQLPESPTTIEVRFSYVPSFPLNNINVKFSLDTSTGALVSESTTQGV